MLFNQLGAPLPSTGPLIAQGHEGEKATELVLCLKYALSFSHPPLPHPLCPRSK
jgi:hypothetical protein